MSAETKVLPANIADDAAPQSIVQIENDELSCAARYSPEGRHAVAGCFLEYFDRKGPLGQIPHARVVRTFSRFSDPSRRAGPMDPVGMLDALGKPQHHAH